MATDFVQQPEADGPPRVPEDHVVRSTRTSRIWTVAIMSALVLVFLLIFIVENGKRVTVSFLGIDGHLPLGVALLFAAIAGALLLAIPGVGRIFQLRRVARHHRATEAEPPSVR